MKTRKRVKLLHAGVIILIVTALYFYGNIVLFYSMYGALFLIASFRTLQIKGRRRTRFLLIVTYFSALMLQVVFYTQVVGVHDVWEEHPFRRLLAVALLLLPFVIGRYGAVDRAANLHLPTLQEAATISFSQVSELADTINQALTAVKQAKGRLSHANLKRFISDLPSHNSFRYVNEGNLTDEYFKAARATLSDPYIYIAISNTGAAASELASAFTRKVFNHSSLSFDRGLQTVISYNGGERVYPPGLNPEMLEFFYQKPDASILIYRMAVSYEQKLAVIEEIERINSEGSAYNLMGVITNKSHKPNIMYCSQFVNKMLTHIGEAYFETDSVIKPTDFIERDYYRKLEFVEELKLNK